MDKYKNYEELRKGEPGHFEIMVKHRTSGVAIIAPHGGSIEGGTTEIAKAIAGKKHTFYSFVGLMNGNNYDTLHITSTRFKEPHALEAVKDADIVVAIHGYRSEKDVVYVGSPDKTLKQRVRDALRVHFNAEDAENAPTLINAESSENICNLGKRKKSIQLELGRGLRARMFKGGNYQNSKARENRTPVFDGFVKVLSDLINVLVIDIGKVPQPPTAESES